MIAIILAGGSGTRFWPLSRTRHPKQFLSIAGERSLLQLTAKRALNLVSPDKLFVVTHESHALETCTQLKPFGIEAKQIFAESSGKNTAPATLLMTCLMEKEPDTVTMIFPADHFIEPQNAFDDTLQKAASIAKEGFIVSLGIKPSRPETGFGYLKRGKPLDPSLKGYHVENFFEKPSLDKAKTWFEDDHYSWNSGIFVSQAKTLLSEAKSHCPSILQSVKNAARHFILQDYGWNTLSETGREIFDQVDAISLDHALMEKSKKLAMLPANFDWNDIGTFIAYQDFLPKDNNNNALKGDAVLIDSHENIISGGDRLIAAIGVDNLIVIDTKDALLICPKENAQRIKEVSLRLQKENRKEAESSSIVPKPWGSFTILSKQQDMVVKRIDVNPQSMLSLQSHQHRDEQWLVTLGLAKVQIGLDEIIHLKPGESLSIPRGTKHRLINPSDSALSIIEIQTGPLLDEKDITRFEDLYGREGDSS